MSDLLRMSLNGAVMVAAVCALRAVFKRHLPRTAFVVLWLTALFRLLCPVHLPSAASIWRLLERQPAASQITGGAIPSAPRVMPAEPVAASAPLEMLWLTVAVALLALVGAFYVAWMIRALRAKRLPCGAYRCKGLAAPQVCGVLFPRILLPEDIGEAELRYVLLHERVHVRRLDNLWKLLALLAAAVHWFNPAAWVLVVLLSHDLEVSCDEWVLRGFDGEQRQAYALSLLALAERPAGRSLLTSGFLQNPLEERIRCIMQGKKKSIFIVLAAVVMTMCTVAAFATDAPAISFAKQKAVEYDPADDSVKVKIMEMDDAEVFTAEEYEAYLEEQKVALQKGVEDGTLSQEDYDATIAGMETLLEGIKAGTTQVCKPFVTEDGAFATYSFIMSDDAGEDYVCTTDYTVKSGVVIKVDGDEPILIPISEK